MAMRLVLAVSSSVLLVAVIRLISLRFDVVALFMNDLAWLVDAVSSGTLTVEPIDKNNDVGDDVGDAAPLWYAFLLGEFTLSVLLPLGVHGLLTSTRATAKVTKSVSTYLVLAIVMGLFLAHRSIKEDEDSAFGTMVGRNRMILLALLAFVLAYILFLDPGKRDTNPKTIRMANKGADGAVVYYTFQAVRLFVKLGGLFNVLAGCMVLYMGTSALGPPDLLPNLVWEGFGTRYDVEPHLEETRQIPRSSFM